MKPWLEDPKYGGMSEESARRSYEAWERSGRKAAPSRGLALPAPDAEIARVKLNIGVQLDEYEQAVADALSWQEDWKDRRPKGFRAMRRSNAGR